MCQTMMRSIQPPESKQATTLQVAVRCRPLTAKEKLKSRDILRVIDDKVVVVLDPDTSKDYLDRVQNRSKEKKYAYDVAFSPEAKNADVYNVTASAIVEGVVRGLNATIFAYGATGSGKTHTMAGTPEDPGLMVLSLQSIFALISKQEADYEFEVTCSYLEVYNEVIYDLLERSSGHLELREDPDQGITVAGLKRIKVSSAEKILELLTQGNNRRKTESTDANATSSRSHAVLEIMVKRKQRNHYRAQTLRGKLALVDLAGSERASETNNAGQKLRDGANINRSLLALANCINALGKQQKKGLAYVPYRNSKLTRLLKDGLSGNSRTVMVATVSCGADQYHHTTNTLKYADRAKEIKTHIQTNVGTVDAHVADYQQMIDNLQVEVTQLRMELADKETKLSARTQEKETSVHDELSWLDVLSHDINENVEERINLQKALFELEDMNLHNRAELQQLDDLIADPSSRRNGEKDETLVERRQIVLDNIRDNDEAGAHYREEIENNEAQRKELQRRIDEAIDSDRNKTFLRILTQYRLLGMTNMELQFQMAIRDQIIHDQREALSNLWLVLECSGLNHEQILEIAAQQGIMIEEGIMPVVAGRTHVPSTPIPILHKQPILSSVSGSKSPAVAQLQYCSDTVLHDSERFHTQHRHDNVDGNTCTLMTAADDWKSTSQGNGGHSDVNDNHYGSHPTVYKNPADLLRIDGVGLGHTNGDVVRSFTSKKVRGARPPSVVDNNGYIGIANSTGQEQPNFKDVGDGLVSSSFTLPKVLTHPRSRRRPRSAESRHQRYWTREGYDTTTGSEGSEAEPCNLSPHDNQARPRLDRVKEGAQQPLDQESLRMEFERLDNELQDLKRGIETPSTIEGSNPETVTSDATNGKDVRQAGYRSSSELPTIATKSSNGSLSLHLPLKAPSVSNSESRHSLSQHSNSSWQSGNPGSTDEVGSQEVDVTKLTGSDLSDSYSSVISRRSTSSARRKPRFDSQTGARQSQPRAIVDWK
ncbi:hypothetical protein M758_2G036500 [Ceratodon purpureus]|nr:hypothetical protein M758_2G036500 [Ceratodon purpureus]